VRRKLGKALSSERTNWKVNAGTGGTHILLFYKTQFEHGVGDEQFAFVNGKSGPLLVGYYINSNALITR
jgi:hypothetical protein